jgi:hypothetical protein
MSQYEHLALGPVWLGRDRRCTDYTETEPHSNNHAGMSDSFVRGLTRRGYDYESTGKSVGSKLHTMIPPILILLRRLSMQAGSRRACRR